MGRSSPSWEFTQPLSKVCDHENKYPARANCMAYNITGPIRCVRNDSDVCKIIVSGD